MSAETNQSASSSLLNGLYEWIHADEVASFLGAHPLLSSLLEDLHCQLSTTFPGARFVARHLSSPRVPSPTGDGHLLVVVVPGVEANDQPDRLSDLLREWKPRDAAARAFLLVAVASDAIDPYASDEDARALYVRLRSDEYTKYLDAARRFVDAPPGSDERALAAAELSTVRLRTQGLPTDERGGDPREVLARLRQQTNPATGAG
jgi:hypothetical protein